MCREGEEREELEDWIHEPWGSEYVGGVEGVRRVGNQASQGSSQVDQGSRTPPEGPEQVDFGGKTSCSL